MVVLDSREVGVGVLLENRRGVWTLKRQKRSRVTHVLELRVELPQMLADVSEVLCGIRSVDDHHDPVFRSIDEAVVFYRSAVVEDRRVVSLTDYKRGDVVCRDIVDKSNHFRTGHHELAHVADVEQAGVLPHRLVFRGYA